MEIQNKKLDEGVFMQERQEVLGQWPTGKDVDLQEAADYQKRLSPERVFSTKLLEAKKAGRTLIQPRAGVPVIEEHIKLSSLSINKNSILHRYCELWRSCNELRNSSLIEYHIHKNELMKWECHTNHRIDICTNCIL